MNLLLWAALAVAVLVAVIAHFELKRLDRRIADSKAKLLAIDSKPALERQGAAETRQIFAPIPTPYIDLATRKKLPKLNHKARMAALLKASVRT